MRLARIERLEIGELVVRQLTVLETTASPPESAPPG